jgi:predicted tellurium resistance membrane protein TerC
MHAVVKVLIGLIMIAIGLGLFAESLPQLNLGIPLISGIDWLGNFIVLLTGFIPPFLILIGLFVVWLEIDEIKAERELRAEEEKEKREKEKQEKEKPEKPKTKKK